MNKENQSKIIELVRQTKPLIFQEMTHEKVTEKGAADYVTNVDVAVQKYLKEALGNEFPDIRTDCRREREPWAGSRINHTGFWIPLTEPPI